VPSTQVTTEVYFRPSALAGATSSFVLMGAVASIYGPLLNAFSHRFNESIPTVGLVISVNFVGAFLGVLLGWIGVKRVAGGIVLAAAAACMAVGALASALMHSWILFLVAVFVVGLGFGGLDFCLNTLLTRTSEQGRALRLNAANAGYGVGAVLGPLLIIWLHPINYQTIFVIISAAGLIATALNHGVHAPALGGEANQRRISMRKTERRPILITFVIAYVLYVSMETSSSGWMATQVHDAGYSESIGSLVTAGFWAGFAIGRGFGTPVYHWLSDKILVLGGLALATILCVLAYSGSLAPYAYPMLGLTIALVFPMGLLWYTELCPSDSDGIALMILFMMAGGILGPGLESLMVSDFGVRVVPIVVASLALADFAVFASALRFKSLDEN
jgi:FHS family glucose/mannose:H+ symporter-like MFS transporter